MPIVEDSKLDWAKEIDEKDTGKDQIFCLSLKNHVELVYFFINLIMLNLNLFKKSNIMKNLDLRK